MSLLYTFNLRHLRAVQAVAERGSVSAAAVEINLSQPALTQGIARIEAQLGQHLFERRSDGMIATAAGRVLSARMALAAEHLAQSMRAIRRGATGGFSRSDRLVTMVQLRALIALARQGSFVSAAHATDISQPALHRAIRDVERLSGVVLVERRGRGVALSPAGSRLARGFRLAAAELDTALAEVAALSGEDHGRIVIGAMPLSRALFLPRAIARFHRANPVIRFDIVEGSHAELIEPLRDGEIDFLIGALRDPAPGRDVEQRPLFADHLAVVARADHPLAGRGDVPVVELARYPWLMARGGTPLRAHFEQLFAEADVKVPDVRIESGSVMMLRGLMQEGDFLTLLSPDQVVREFETGQLAMVGDRLARTVRTIGITSRAGWQPTESQRRFIALLEDMALSYNSGI